MNETAPPPSPALLDAVAKMKAVRARQPLRTLFTVAAASLVYAALAFLIFPARRDLAALPLAWWLGLALVWFAGFVAPLTLALLPRRGAVVPDSERAVRVALATTLGLITIGLTLTRNAPPLTDIPDGPVEVAESLLHCMPIGLVIASMPLGLGIWALKGVVLVGSWRVGAALGAAGGALGGLVLHTICWTGGRWHVACSHGGAVLVGAIIGAFLGPLILERRR